MGVDTFLLLYSSITFTMCVGKVKIPSITFRIFSILSLPFKILIHVFVVLKPGLNCNYAGGIFCSALCT